MCRNDRLGGEYGENRHVKEVVFLLTNSFKLLLDSRFRGNDRLKSWMSFAGLHFVQALVCAGMTFLLWNWIPACASRLLRGRGNDKKKMDSRFRGNDNHMLTEQTLNYKL